MIELEAALLRIRSKSHLIAFLNTILTHNEFEQCRRRWHACQLIMAGATQRDVRDKLKVGIATASRAARAVRDNRVIVRVVLGTTRSTRT
jgi:TrpR family trp operon transcriptional repressor